MKRTKSNKLNQSNQLWLFYYLFGTNKLTKSIKQALFDCLFVSFFLCLFVCLFVCFFVGLYKQLFVCLTHCWRILLLFDSGDSLHTHHEHNCSASPNWSDLAVHHVRFSVAYTSNLHIARMPLSLWLPLVPRVIQCGYYMSWYYIVTESNIAARKASTAVDLQVCLWVRFAMLASLNCTCTNKQ